MSQQTRSWLIHLVALVVGGVFIATQLLAATRDAARSAWWEGSVGYVEALRQQMDTAQPIMVYFYADWCTPCQRFQQQVLSDPSVAEFIGDYILVKVTPDHGGAEVALARRYGVVGYPSIFIVRAGADGPVRLSLLAEMTPQRFLRICRDAAGQPRTVGRVQRI